MKLVIAVVQVADADACTSALMRAGHQCTRLASAGGFLDRPNATLLVGVDDSGVDSVIHTIRGRARLRAESLSGAGAGRGPGTEVEVGGATVFVADVERVEKL